MSKDRSGKGLIIDDAFRREAVRLLSTSGRTVAQVANDLGIGRSTLTKWKSNFAEAKLLAGPHDDVNKELAPLRRENERLRAERPVTGRASSIIFIGVPRRLASSLNPTPPPKWVVFLRKATAFFAKESSR